VVLAASDDPSLGELDVEVEIHQHHAYFLSPSRALGPG
jgi:hypothetical protein